MKRKFQVKKGEPKVMANDIINSSGRIVGSISCESAPGFNFIDLFGHDIKDVLEFIEEEIECLKKVGMSIPEFKLKGFNCDSYIDYVPGMTKEDYLQISDELSELERKQKKKIEEFLNKRIKEIGATTVSD